MKIFFDRDGIRDVSTKGLTNFKIIKDYKYKITRILEIHELGYCIRHCLLRKLFEKGFQNVLKLLEILKFLNKSCGTYIILRERILTRITSIRHIMSLNNKIYLLFFNVNSMTIIRYTSHIKTKITNKTIKIKQ